MAEGETRESWTGGDSATPATSKDVMATATDAQEDMLVGGHESSIGNDNEVSPNEASQLSDDVTHEPTSAQPASKPDDDTQKQHEKSSSADEDIEDAEEKKTDSPTINNNNDEDDVLTNGYHDDKSGKIDSFPKHSTDNRVDHNNDENNDDSAKGEQRVQLSRCEDTVETTSNGELDEAGYRSPMDPLAPLERSNSRKPNLEELTELEQQQETMDNGSEQADTPKAGNITDENESKQQETTKIEQRNLEHDVASAELARDVPLTDVNEPLGTIKEAPNAESPARASRFQEAAQIVGSDQGDTENADHALSLEVLRNKDKEGFALLAMGDSMGSDSFRGVAPDIVTVPKANRSPDKHAVLDAMTEPDQAPAKSIEAELMQTSPMKPRLDPLAVSPPDSQRLSRVSQATPTEDRVSEYDDNSYRPSFSYPGSPQGSQTPVQPNPYLAPGQGYVMITQPPPVGAPHAFMAPTHPPQLHHQSSFNSQHSMMGRPSAYGYQPMPAMQPPANAKRKIRLRLQEEMLARPKHARRSSFFFGARSARKLTKSDDMMEIDLKQVNEVDRGVITVSWYDGTSSAELQEHVYKSVARKLGLGADKKLDDIRILDMTSDPPEETVLCPYIPSGSEFLLRYKTKLVEGLSTPPDDYGPPESPSAAPSPFSSHANLSTLNESQLAIIRKQLDAVQAGESRKTPRYERRKTPRASTAPPKAKSSGAAGFKSKSPEKTDGDGSVPDELEDSEGESVAESETNTLQPESSVDAKLRQITELLLIDRQQKMQHRHEPRTEKRQVIFVLANYFVLFIAFITISAEIQARLPNWIASIEKQLENVHQCSADQESLFECVTRGEFAGLFASVILWLSRSATTKQFFLFGFETPNKLWSVFYESLVSAVCWGISYMFIRRGLNPDTRPNFLRKYWKDAIYGALAGFNANFMKQALKNLLPKESIEEAFNDRQLKILSWLPTFH